MTRLKFCDKIINVNKCNYGYLYEVNMEEGKIMEKIEPFKQKVWLASPTMHGEELEYVTEAYNTNWMSTVGKNLIILASCVSGRKKPAGDNTADDEDTFMYTNYMQGFYL